MSACLVVVSVQVRSNLSGLLMGGVNAAGVSGPSAAVPVLMGLQLCAEGSGALQVCHLRHL